MTWEDNRRGASTEDGLIIEEGTPMDLIPRNIHWHDNYMHSFTKKGVKIANLKKAITTVSSLPEVGDAEVFYRLYPGDAIHKAGIYYWDGANYIYDDAPTLVRDHNTSPTAHADIRALIQAMSTDMKYKGSVEDADHLPTNAKRGDVYTTRNDGKEYVWDGEVWVEIGGGGSDVSLIAGKGIEIKDSAPLAVTINVSGEMPGSDRLPLNINVSDVEPGSTLLDLYYERKIGDDDLFYWYDNYELTTSGFDSNVAEITGPIMELYVLKLNGAGTTTGTVTARIEESGEEYTATVTVTATAGESSKKVSADIYNLGASFFESAEFLEYGDTLEGEDALAALGGHDGFANFVKAVENDAEFVATIDGQNIHYEKIMSAPYALAIQHPMYGSLSGATFEINFEEGDDESIEITKDRAVNLFTDDFDGLVPKADSPQTGLKFLRDDGTWAEFNGLRLDNTTAYTPTGNYNPATKKYVDDAVGNIDTLLANLISGGGAE